MAQTLFQIDNISLILIFTAGFALVHIFKLFRLYLVLLEQGLSFRSFMRIYFETTCINFIIPFKLGEIYRVCRLSMATGRLAIGLLSVLTDRFFDTASLLLLLFVLRFLGLGEITPVMAVLLLVILGMAFFYLSFPSVYRYLNNYIMVNRGDAAAVRILGTLEYMNNAYIYLHRLVRGRYPLMILLSLLGWCAEGVTLRVLAMMTGQRYGINEYAEYISSIFVNNGSGLLHYYSTISIILLAIAALAGFLAGLLTHNKVKSGV